MPIGELSRRLGVSTDLLRKWERRYAVLKPGRTIGNQRLYSHLDEARARVMLRHVRNGVPPAQAAELAIATRFRITTGATSETTTDQLAVARGEMQGALERYDETTAEQALEKLFASANPATVIRDVFLPYLQEIGARWADGHLNVAQEHFASGFIHSRLIALARGWDRGLGPRALLACAPGEQHTFGLIAFGIALHELGWRITYLGADTPVPMVVEAASSVQPRLTTVTAAMPGALERAVPELRELAARWPLAIAGAGSSQHLADRCGALHVPDDPITAAKSVFG
jgi:MerR family transcriptional regulator, light-induced transcriptional regulator